MAVLRQRQDGGLYILQPFTLNGEDSCTTFQVEAVGETVFGLLKMRDGAPIERRLFFALYLDGAIHPGGGRGSISSYRQIPSEWHTNTFFDTGPIDRDDVLKRAVATRRFNVADAVTLVLGAMPHNPEKRGGVSVADVAARLFLTVKWMDYKTDERRSILDSG